MCMHETWQLQFDIKQKQQDTNIPLLRWLTWAFAAYRQTVTTLTNATLNLWNTKKIQFTIKKWQFLKVFVKRTFTTERFSRVTGSPLLNLCHQSVFVRLT